MPMERETMQWCLADRWRFLLEHFLVCVCVI